MQVTDLIRRHDQLMDKWAKEKVEARDPEEQRAWDITMEAFARAYSVSRARAEMAVLGMGEDQRVLLDDRDRRVRLRRRYQTMRKQVWRGEWSTSCPA